MPLGMHDKTGQPPTLAEAEEAVAVVQKAMISDVLTLPPYLAVQLANIHRCLTLLVGALRKAGERGEAQ